MTKWSDTKVLLLVVMICLVVGAASWPGRDFFFGRGLDAAPTFLLVLLRVAVVLALLVLVSALVMKVSGLEGTRKYITALFLSTSLVALSVCGEIGWFTAHYGVNGLISLLPISVSLKPPVLPITFTIDTQGHISIEPELAVVTPLGDVVLSTQIPGSQQPQENVLQLTIIHMKDGVLYHAGYKIYTGKEKVVVITNGVTRIEISRGEVVIDASNGNIQTIQIQQSSS